LDSKVDELLILDKRTQYFIIFRRTSWKRGYLPSSPITALFGAFFPTLIYFYSKLKPKYNAAWKTDFVNDRPEKQYGNKLRTYRIFKK
jgi:hypothetical protein